MELVLSVYNADPTFSLKNFSKRVHIIYGIIISCSVYCSCLLVECNFHERTEIFVFFSPTIVL